MELKTGMTGRAELVVAEEHTAAAVASGLARVFATPMLVALMEKAAYQSVEDAVEGSTVGTYMAVKHTAATPVGLRVWAEARLVEIDRRRLKFQITAWDEREQIGEAEHERFIIDPDKFMQKAQAKRA